MKKHFSSEFKGMFDDDRNDINVNLWDLDGSSFFLDRNINYNNNLGATGTFINTEYNANNDNNNSNLINIISSKNKKKENINFPVQKDIKNKNKFVNVNTRKGSDTPTTYEKKNLMKNKIIKNNKIKKNKFKNNSFCHNDNENYNINDSLSKNFSKNRQKNATAFINKKNYNSKAKPRLNISVGRQRLNNSVGKQRLNNSVGKQRLNNSMGYHSKKDDSNASIILGYNNLKDNYYKNNKKKNLNKSLPIEDLDDYFDDCENYSNIEDNIILNLRCNKYMSNNTKKIKKSNSLDNNIYNNKKIISTNNNIKYPEKLISNNSQRKKEPKINMENNIKTTKNKSVASKKSIEDAEKYTHYLANRKIFTHDYELQNKLRKQREELETQKEMSQCTFKPQLIKNKYNTRIQSQKNKDKKSMYEKQSKWLRQLQNKNKNERDKKIKKEIQGCTFIPQLSNLPKYTNKNRITFREKIGEENYYNQMKKARQIVQERNKPDDLIERYDERRKREGMTARPMLTFGEFDQDINSSNIPEEYNFINNKIGVYPNSLNNIIVDNYKDNINLNEYINNKNKINEDIINVNIKNNINDNIINDANFKSNINNNYVFNSNINNNYIGLNNNNNAINKNILNIIYDNNRNNLINNNSMRNQNSNQINLNTNYLNNINNTTNKVPNIQKINNRNDGKYNNNYSNNIPLNSAGFVNNLNLNKNKNSNKNNSYNKYVNQRNKNNLNNFDLDKNFTEEIFINNIQLNAINNYRNIFPKNEEQDKEIINISTETGTKNNSILSLQKKSTHSLQDKPNKNENVYVNNVSHFKIGQNQEFNQNINNDNNNDDEYNKQKLLLMNELHNWKNFDEDSNEED